ncbi:MAG: hypothetical protein HZA67_14120 [Rhodospirillales bacterium]|jgi:hypothetical protein|nr:hypothetical protein [Rhodospirillales bacterium]
MGESLQYREEDRLAAALELIERLGQPNLAFVPRMPSNNMLAAAMLAGDVSPERARRVWQAMLETAER